VTLRFAALSGVDSLRGMNESELALRRMRYRLNRQGMLELDAWLGRLLQADLQADGVMVAIDALLQYEPPELQAMMHGKTAVPASLKPWL